MNSIRETTCVIGAGLAGGIVAAKLAAAGRRVILVEQGLEPTPLIPEDEVWQGGALKSAYTRGEGLGGSSNFWHGGVIALERSDVDGVPGKVGQRFPISFSEICDYYRSALTLLTNREVTLDDLLGDSDVKVPFDTSNTPFQLKPLIFPAKPFSTRGIIEEARDRHGLEIVRFHAESLRFNAAGKAVALEGFYPEDKRRGEIVADRFILSAGGIGSPKILLNSATRFPQLASLPIGQGLIDHPTGFVFKAKLRKRRNLKAMFGANHGATGKLKRRWGLRLRENELELSHLRNHVLYLRPAFGMRDPRDYTELKNKLVRYRGRPVSLREKLQLVKYLDLFMEALNFRFGLFSSTRYVAGFVFIEQAPTATNKIVRQADGSFVVHWAVTPDDVSSLDAFLKTFFDAYAEFFEDSALFSGLLDSGAHHSGTCRMASSAAEGVVDDHYRVFGTQNVFVVDASVLGSTGHANTGLTIAALALRCVDTLKNTAIGPDPSVRDRQDPEPITG